MSKVMPKTNIMRSEILQQPAVCAQMLDRETRGLEKLIKKLKKKPPVGIVLAARGSSDHAAVYARYLLEHLTNIPTHLAAPSLLTVYKDSPNFKNYLVIGISQSGQGPDINAVVAKAARQGAITLGITNNTRSNLAKVCTHVINLGAEKEKAIAATKTYSAELMAVTMLGVMWAGSKLQQRQVQGLPELMDIVIDESEAAVDKVARRMKTMKSCVVVGRGFQLGNAYEFGLKLKECAGVVALSYSTADFLHGPVQLAQGKFPVFMLSGPGCFEKEMHEYTRDYLARGARVIRMGLKDDQTDLLARHPRLDATTLVKADIDEAISPVLTILPGQWFSFYSAIHKGLDPAMPTGLKKVTKTT